MADAITRPRRRSLARVGGLVVMFLAFGAVVNFGVAWWCVRGFEREYKRPGVMLLWLESPFLGFITPKRIDELPKRWTVRVPANWPAPTSVSGGEFGWTHETDEQYTSPNGGQYLSAHVAHIEVGWPLRCWWGADRHLDSTLESVKSGDFPLWYVNVPLGMDRLLGVHRLPIGIHPLPFIVNTLVYAAIPFALWLPIGPLRRWRRRRAGRCTACGYDRAGLAAGAVCPECGRAGAA